MSSPSVFSAANVSAQEIAVWLESGATVVLPTETVYGLAVKPDRPASVQRVFELKGRPAQLNLPVVIGTLGQLSDLGVDFNDIARSLAHRFWPGPLTIIMGFRTDRRPPWLESRVEVAVRLPAFELLREIAIIVGPILVTSANGHRTGPKRVAREAVESLHGQPDLVVDGGVLSPIPSTIVNTRYSPARVERSGALTTADLQDFLRENLVALEGEWQA